MNFDFSLAADEAFGTDLAPERSEPAKKEDKNGLVFVPLIRIFLSSKQYLEESLIDQNDDYDYSRSYFAVLFR